MGREESHLSEDSTHGPSVLDSRFGSKVGPSLNGSVKGLLWRPKGNIRATCANDPNHVMVAKPKGNSCPMATLRNY